MPGERAEFVLRRRHRLSRDADYAAVFAARVRKHRGPLTVFARPNGLGEHRLGLSIGRRVGGSVRRGRLKRMLREAFRLERAGMSGSYDFVVTARSHEGMPLAWYREAFAGLAAQLDAAWRRREREGTRRGGRG